MSVPYTLYNSTAYRKYVIDADELNANFEYLDDRITDGDLPDGVIKPRHISQGITDVFIFPAQIVIGITDYWVEQVEGTIFCKRETDGSSAFYGVCKSSEGDLQYIAF